MTYDFDSERIIKDYIQNLLSKNYNQKNRKMNKTCNQIIIIKNYNQKIIIKKYDQENIGLYHPLRNGWTILRSFEDRV